MNDPVHHPSHYTAHPSGIECIELAEWLPFNLGNALKYLWRAGAKDNTPHVTDLKKAAWYLRREVGRRAEMGSDVVGSLHLVNEDARRVLAAETSESPLADLLRLLADDHGWFAVSDLTWLANRLDPAVTP